MGGSTTVGIPLVTLVGGRVMRELRILTIIATVIAFCVLAALALAIAMVISPGRVGVEGRHKDWFVHVTAESLVQYSEHIVVARYDDEAVHEIPDLSRDPTVVQSHRDVYRRFEVVESLKGDFQPGDSIYVGWNAGYTKVDRISGTEQFIPRVVRPLARGEIHGLFLNLQYSRSRHPDDPRARIWRTPQGLEVALVDAQGRFSFQTDQYYRNALKDMDLKPVPGSGAPFELTTHDVERLVASGSGGVSQQAR